LEGPADLGRAEHDADHALAQDNDHQQTEPLGKMPRVDRRATEQPPGANRRGVLDRERDGPEDVFPWNGDGERDHPETDRDAEPEDEPPSNGPRGFEVAVDAEVENEQDRPDADVGDDEAVLAAVKRMGDGAGQAGDREHPEQGQQAVDEVVGVEPCCVERETGPGPEDREEEEEKAAEAGRGRIRAQRRAGLGDRGDEDEVEKQLEPRRAAVYIELQRAQPWGIEKASEPAQAYIIVQRVVTRERVVT
jgi:hypothetical protein